MDGMNAEQDTFGTSIYLPLLCVSTEWLSATLSAPPYWPPMFPSQSLSSYSSERAKHAKPLEIPCFCALIDFGTVEPERFHCIAVRNLYQALVPNSTA
jgi:hypothetical protein